MIRSRYNGRLQPFRFFRKFYFGSTFTLFLSHWQQTRDIWHLCQKRCWAIPPPPPQYFRNWNELSFLYSPEYSGSLISGSLGRRLLVRTLWPARGVLRFVSVHWGYAKYLYLKLKPLLSQILTAEISELVRFDHRIKGFQSSHRSSLLYFNLLKI